MCIANFNETGRAIFHADVQDDAKRLALFPKLVKCLGDLYWQENRLSGTEIRAVLGEAEDLCNE